MTSVMNISNLLRLNINVRVYTFGGSGVGKTSFLFGRPGAPGSIIDVVTKSLVRESKIAYACHEIYGRHDQLISTSTDALEIDQLKYWVHRLNGSLTLDDLDDANQSPNYRAPLSTPSDNGSASGGTGNMVYDFKHLTPNPRPMATKSDLFSDDYPVYKVKEMCKHLRLLDGLVTEQRQIDQKRIRPTKNNPSSSRSILVYTFRITTDGVITYLQVVDMMGYEDFSGTSSIEDKPPKYPSHIGHLRLGYKPPKPKTVVIPQELLDEGHFIRYSLLLAANHTNVSERMNNELFNFPFTTNTTLKNIGIYIVNNTGANKTKIKLLFQSAQFGRPKVNTCLPGKSEDDLGCTCYTMRKKADDILRYPFKISFPNARHRPVARNSPRLLEIIEPLGLDETQSRRSDVSTMALIAAVKNREIKRYFDMQKDQVDFLDSLNLAPELPVE
jgi:hypothetical protein